MGKFKKSYKWIGVMGFLLVLIFTPKLTAEAAASNDEIAACAQIFDGSYYATLYPDVAASTNGNELALLNHYIYFGINENRNASASFNATDYRLKNPDLNAVYGDNMLAYVYHYVHSGMNEGRDAKPNAGSEISVPSKYKLLGIYSTEYDSQVPRATNIKIAASKVNGTVVAPGKTFSANKAIGPRTSANGYVTAPVFINKEHAMGLGGGVCQVSSTIYAAMKVAGIPATERHAHSLPVNYLPSGWDATISYGSVDLKFKNTFDKNIVVYETANNGYLTAALYLEN